MTEPLVPSSEQKAILAAGPGPLRIAAGAGTGKTTTLALRVVALIRSGIEPGEILGITFTNKAAAELATRIDELLDDDGHTLHGVDIKTYHGFAHALLEEFGPLVGIERGAGVITPTFARQLISQAIDEAPVSELNVTWDGVMDVAAQLAARLADNLASPSMLRESDATGPAVERNDYAAVLTRYEEEKERLGVVDYGDLIAKAHQLATEFPDVAARIRSRYRAVFLDEYQDTNPAQRLLLSAIFGDGFPVDAVGDADQTIYEWRGASQRNFADFPQHFPMADGTPAPTLSLTLNRRSARKIIGLANTIRTRIGDDPAGDLVPLEDAPDGSVDCRWFSTAVDEAGFIADELTRLHESGFAWRDMAILFRKNRQIELIRHALEDADIPVEVASVGGLLDIPEIADLHAWLRLIEHPDDSAALLRILLGSRYRMGFGELRPLAAWTEPPNRDDSEAAMPRSMIEAIEIRDTLPGLDDRTRHTLSDFWSTYRLLVESAQGLSLAELVRLILGETGAWPEIEAMPSAARQSARLNVYRFLDLAEDWSPLEGRPSLGTFLSYLRLMAEDEAEELSAANLSGEDAVALLTVHRAKGLEWEVVVVPALYKDNFPAKLRAHDDPYTRPAALPYELRIDERSAPPISADQPERERKAILSEAHLRAEWRLAYVAVTRAKRHLWLTGAWWYGHPVPTKHPAKVGALYEVAVEHSGSRDHGTAPVPDEAPASLRPPPGGPGPDPLFGDDGLSTAVNARMNDAEWARDQAVRHDAVGAYDAAVDGLQQLLFSLPPPIEPDEASSSRTISVTGLVTYATCPKRYFWTDVDPLPRRPSRAARRGIEVHRRIELHNRGTIPLSEAGVDFYDATTDDTADPARTGPSPFEVFTASRFARQRPLRIEAPFELALDTGLVRGRIDAIYDGWEIVDFKSGRPSSNPATKRQLQVYALAVDQGQLGAATRPLRVTFAHLGGGRLTEQTEDVDASWLEEARHAVDSDLSAIGEGKFEATPGDHCVSCDFLTFCETGKRFVESYDTTA